MNPHLQLPALSERETEVLQQLGRGKSNAEIAHALHLAPGTVKIHLGSIMAKWDVRDRVQVVLLAAKAGLIRLS
ncbi:MULTISPECIES: response regulator transcription factor [unclassified Microbacterium]|uniref:response regulator transcription factor n=1 Tax=unclassified Microbacterium TaxID=2609290 RepID=UPI000EA994F9|nr:MULTISPECIES: LuxR C-terminal-related transcriptional regulator [unclassified Microbacterium]MBT2484265.1 response regulator transcription factor [Microbacterium sp. ISL-108]RKN67188.1 DNA-binding response regulator [Microbacterium sp. CGR2]